MTELNIELIPEKLGVQEIKSPLARQIVEKIISINGEFTDIVAAIVDVHKADTDDIRALEDKFSNLKVSGERVQGGVSLKLSGVPRDSLFPGGDIGLRQKQQLSEVVRDFLLSDDFFQEGANISSEIHRFLDRSGYFDRFEANDISFYWGGHSNGLEENEHSKETGYWLGLAGTQIITGCGPSTMEKPFKGAQIAYGKQDFNDIDFIGLTEKGIIAKEAPNGLVNRLVIFPDIEKRLEAFVRSSRMGHVGPGGVGTAEEMMYALMMKSNPKNTGIHYPLHLVEHKGGKYMKQMQDFFHECFGDELDDFYDIFVKAPKEYAEELYELRKKWPKQNGLWNSDIHIDSRVQEPIPITFDEVEKINLSNDGDIHDLLFQMRKLFSFSVDLAIKSPWVGEEWKKQGDLPLVSGDQKYIAAIQELLQRWDKAGRLQVGRDFSLPIRFE